MRTSYFLRFALLKLTILSLMTTELYSSTSSTVFKKYKNSVFIETGSCLGDGIQSALDAGFQEIHSIEIKADLYQKCKNRFKNNKKVHLYLGNSIHILPKILSNLNTTATFWLDGHYSWGITGRGDTNTPLMEELQIISKHPIKNHTILVDDVRQFGSVEFDFIELEEVVEQIQSINPHYAITFEDGHVKNDVLVAVEH